MILLIDNYDSFTYNLVQVMASQGADVKVFRNDEITVEAAAKLNPAGVVISPGPGKPSDAGISMDIIREFSGKVPVLGVCLGHQCIGVVHGGEVANAGMIMHGKISMVTWQGSDLYKGLKNPFSAGRYHSLAVMKEPAPRDLIVDAWTEEGEIMGMRHNEHQTYGVQFHPESVLTPGGKRLLRNFLRITEAASKDS